MVFRKHEQLTVKYGITIFYCIVIGWIAAASVKKPACNWDMLPYMGVVLSYENLDVKEMHAIVYATAKAQVPVVYFNRMTDSSNTYRSLLANNADAFYTQLPFYVVKPLYTRMAWLFYKSGIALTTATVWPSAIAYLITGMLLYGWLRKYGSSVYACVAALCLMLSPPLLNVAGLSSPDALSGLFVFAAVYVLTEMKSVSVAFALLLLAVFTRLDNVLACFGLMTAVFFTGKWNAVIPASRKLLYFGLLLVAFFSVTFAVRSFGWTVFFYPAFMKQLNVSLTAGKGFAWSAYLQLAKAQLTTGLYFSFVSFFGLMLTMLFWNVLPFHFSRLTADQTLALLFVVIMLLRFMLQPLVADRIYSPYYLSVAVFLVRKYSPQPI